MRTIISLTFVFFAVFIMSANGAKKKVSNDYYDKTFLGESNFDLYYGPHDPLLKRSNHLGESGFADDEFFNHFIDGLVQDDIFKVEDFWSQEVQGMNACPNFYLNENLSYIRYLYRLVTISYLFESIKDHATLAYKLGYEEKTCSLDWKDIFGKCTPQTLDMKKFLKRTKYRYLMNYDIRKFKRLSKGERKDWLNKELAGLLKKRESVTFERLAQSCHSGSCRSLKKVENVLKSSCREDKELIEMICSERDDLYGISWLNKPMAILTSSHVMRNLNKGGFANACLDRYANLNKEKEMHYKRLNNLFAPVYKQLRLSLSASTYIEGELFLPGALKEFDDRGLEDFLFVKPKIVAKKVIAKVKPKVKPKPIVKVVPKKAKPTIVKVVASAAKPKIKPLSSFEQAVKRVADDKVKLAKVDMIQFEKDFTFTERMVKALSTPLADYQTRSALKDMKTFDKLGSKQEPLRLLFLKFLIDRDQHTGLWNVISIIGKQFYVINDIDKKNEPVAIKLSNDVDSKYKWQLSIIDGIVMTKKDKKK
jgi:hypothetical protein